MQNFIEKHHDLWIFRLDEAATVVGNKHSAPVLLKRYVSAGLVKRIRRNSFVAINFGTKAIEVNRRMSVI